MKEIEYKQNISRNRACDAFGSLSPKHQICESFGSGFPFEGFGGPSEQNQRAPDSARSRSDFEKDWIVESIHSL